MLIGYKRGQGSIVLRIKILNNSVATGAGLTGLSSASSGLIISTIADNEATATAYTVAASNVETVTTLGTFAAPTAGKCRFREVDSTNHKGVYEIQLADARFGVSNAKSLLVSVLGATNAAETDVVIPLRGLDPFDSVRAGLTALPNVVSGSAGSLLTSGTGTSQLNVSGGTAAADMVEISGQTVTAATAVTFPETVSSLTAADVRAELAVELARIDTTVGSRLASASYAAPLNAAGTRAAVGLTAANLDAQLAALPLASVWTTTRAGFLDSVLLAVNSNRTVQVTGSHHVAAVLHDSEPGAIHTTTFDTGAIDATVLAGSAASEIATAVRTEVSVELAGIMSLVAKFTGMTTIAGWLRTLTRKTAGDSVALAEINTGGTGAFVPSTMALETLPSISGGGGGPVGPGAISLQETVYKPDGVTPLQNAEVWVSTDASGNNVIAGVLITNAFGQVIFKLDAGTYYLWASHPDYNFSGSSLITVT
jgi:hypothetical protein